MSIDIYNVSCDENKPFTFSLLPQGGQFIDGTFECKIKGLEQPATVKLCFELHTDQWKVENITYQGTSDYKPLMAFSDEILSSMVKKRPDLFLSAAKLSKRVRELLAMSDEELDAADEKGIGFASLPMSDAWL